ncbi:retropepsin-like aspartic protease [Tunturiibacter gelidiferens]|uniref:retropepsin-like aspartic protease n=1 Tax=Tunturiibacter gelidiferens TaxID=3069689 RepID=UPI003D9B969D
MTTLMWVATASLAATVLPSLYAEARCPGNVASIRPRFVERSIVIVPVILNGSGPYDFVLDTGEQMTTIDPRLASELGLGLQGSARVTGAGFFTRASFALPESLQAGDHVLKNPLLLVHPLGQIQVSDPASGGFLARISWDVSICSSTMRMALFAWMIRNSCRQR